MEINKLQVSDLLAETEVGNISPAKQEIGEQVEEREEYVDYRACRPISDSFFAVPDDES
jgi:hypothetical protein